MVCHQCGKPVEPGQQFCAAAAHRCVASPTPPSAAVRQAVDAARAGDRADRGVGGPQPGVGHHRHRAGDGDDAGADASRVESRRRCPTSRGRIADADVWALTSETYGASSRPTSPSIRCDTTEMPLYPT